jgi:hypothetical protein
MDVGELVNVDIDFVTHDSDCYFCNAKDEPKEETNELETSPDEDEDLDGDSPESFKFKNSSKKLGDALGGPPDNRSIDLGDDDDYPSSVAAHHLIPGNASLKESTLFKAKKYLRVDGMAKGNIGYNINSLPNGVWLPGNYAQRPWGTDGADFAKKSNRTPKEYAFASIREWRAQFHDAHEDYSEFVRQRLDELKQKLDRLKRLWCPKAAAQGDDEVKNLYELVNRLHSLSGRMRTMLVFPTKNWKRNIFTSRFSATYISEAAHSRTKYDL